ncbi:MAG: DegT/DnrJ/EryC1/StrS family aminotransferase [Elusimicrobiota bacterium]
MPVNLISHSSILLGKEEKKALREVLAGEQLAQGAETAKFEQEAADFVGVKGGVAVNSGTAALHLALLSLGVKKGDEVILPSFVCSAPLLAVLYLGAKPVFADINLSDYNLCWQDAARKISSRTKALILPHMFGFPADIGNFLRLGVPVIEDCAHSLGAKYKNKRIGSFGKIAVCSFYATKMICTGEGGMLLSDSRKILAVVRDLREYDQKNIFRIRYNYKMTELQAALGRVQLKKISGFIRLRKKIASDYTNCFKQYEKIILPGTAENSEAVFFRYIIRLGKKSAKFIQELNRQGIIARRPVFQPLHRYFKKNVFLPFTDEAYEKTVSLPIYPALKEQEKKRVMSAVSSLVCED